MKAEMEQRGCPFLGTNSEKWPKIEYLAIFDHFSPFEPAHRQPIDPTSTFIDQNVISGCCFNEICNERVTPGYYHSFFLTSALKLNFWSFLAIFSPFHYGSDQPAFET